MKITIEMQVAPSAPVVIRQAVIAKPASGMTLDAKTIYSFGARFSARFNALLEPDTQAGRQVRNLKAGARSSYVNQPRRPLETSEAFVLGARASARFNSPQVEDVELV